MPVHGFHHFAVSGVIKLCHRYPECQAPKHELFEVD